MRALSADDKKIKFYLYKIKVTQQQPTGSPQTPPTSTKLHCFWSFNYNHPRGSRRVIFNLEIRKWNGRGSQGLNPAASWMDRKQEVWVSIPQMPHSSIAPTHAKTGWGLHIFWKKKNIYIYRFGVWWLRDIQRDVCFSAMVNRTPLNSNCERRFDFHKTQECEKDNRNKLKLH